MQPGPEIDIPALQPVELALEDPRAVVRQRLEIQQSAQGVCRSNGPFQVLVPDGVNDREDRGDWTDGRFCVEQGVKITLNQSATKNSRFHVIPDEGTGGPTLSNLLVILYTLEIWSEFPILT